MALPKTMMFVKRRSFVPVMPALTTVFMIFLAPVFAAGIGPAPSPISSSKHGLGNAGEFQVELLLKHTLLMPLLLKRMSAELVCMYHRSTASQ
jgi:hypothetical protein